MSNKQFASDKHFLDTTILVGAWLEWDIQHNIVKEYIGYSMHERHTSKRAYEEAMHVFENYRKFINKYLYTFQEDFNIDINLRYIDNKISEFNRRYLEGITNEGERTKVNSFIIDYSAQIRNYVLGVGSIDLILDDVKNKIKFALNTLEKECRNDHIGSIFKHEKCPPTYDTFYPDKKSKLKERISYENDILIILDAYHIKEIYVKSNICLITTDYEHMLSKKTDIERILDGIHVEPPNLLHV